MSGRATLSMKGVLMVSIGVLLVITNASAVTTMTMSRTVQGLSPEGNFIPGTSQLSFSVTLELGGDMEAVTALGVAETLPEGWTFAGGTPAGNAPNLFPTAGTTGTGSFAWFSIPSFPATFTYTVNVPEDVVAPVEVTGMAIFRTGGSELTSEEVTTEIKNSIVAVRTVVGTVGPGGAYYRPGTTLDVTVQFTRTFTDILTALGVSDELPAGWTYVNGSVAVNAGNVAPNLTQFLGTTLSFAWFSVPTFPLTLSYQVAIPSDATGHACMNGISLYRTGGPELRSNEFNICLDEEPCLTLDRVVPSQCYAAGQDLTVNVTFTSACTTNLTALGMEETLPEGWTFVSATGGDIKPAAGASGALTFAWFMVPAFPYTFSYVVHVPDPQEDDKTISGQALYRLSGEELRTYLVETVICGADLIPPEITLIGNAEVTVECCDTYVDAGATAWDNIDGDISDQIMVVNPVDTCVPGDYTITYDVCDAATNCAPEATRVVHVVDTVIPVITMNGGATVTVECGANYTDVGATAADTCDPAVNVAVVNPVNTAVPGVYTITYNATDASGNAAVEVTRTVTVQDTTPPVITLVGAATVGVQCGTSYTDQGAVASDVCEGVVNVVMGGDTVNPQAVGTYTITYDAVDSAGNHAVQVTRTVNVGDTINPVITMNGNAVVNLCVGDGYVDAGASATDSCDTDVPVITNNPVNPNVPGSYTVRYSATDDSGNTAAASRTVNVADCTPPVIALTGNANVTVECGGTYVDAGATATDNVDGTVVPGVDNPVPNPATVGVYTVTYTASDTAGNAATPVTRTVTVVDTVPPIITRSGNDAVTVECGGTYTDAGATAGDTCDGDVPVQVDNPVNTSAPGVYTVTYTASDNAGNAAEPVTRQVSVIDSISPVVSLNGDALVIVECGGSYSEASATALDTCGGDVAVTVGGDVVNTSVPGDYVINYAAEDSAGNPGNATRTVRVVDTTAPVVTVTGDDPQIIECNGSYVELGATATDTCEGDLAPASDAASVVDVNTPGQYTVTYTATDGSGNTGTATRTVVVEECVEGEGAEEGEPCDCVFEVVLTAPIGDFYVPLGRQARVHLDARVTFLSTECSGHQLKVLYKIDEGLVGESTDQDGHFPADTTLPIQAEPYMLKVEAHDLDTGCFEEVTHEFSVLHGADNDNNALADVPFAELPGDGDCWQAEAMMAGAGSARVASMISWTNPEGDDLELTVINPDDANQAATIRAPRALIAPGEQGILVGSISRDLTGLLGSVEAAKVAPESEDLAAGGVPFIVGIIVSDDGGITFRELNALSLPVTLSLTGLSFTPGKEATFSDHPSDVLEGGLEGLQISIPENAAWNWELMSNPSSAAGTLTAQTTQLSLFMPVEVYSIRPALLITPNPAGEVNMGNVLLGSSVSALFEVKNIGGGVLNGVAGLVDPGFVFRLTGTTSYSLHYKQTYTITAGFAPTETGEFSATLTFGNASVTPDQQVTITLRGTCIEKEKRFAVFGCAPVSSTGGYLGDVLVMAGGLALLLTVFSRKRTGRVKSR